MSAPRDSRDLPPDRPPVPPPIPPYLVKRCPDPAIVKQQGQFWVAKCLGFLHHWLTRFGNACARRWTALDRAGRLLVVCLGAISLSCALLAIAGWSRRPGDDARTVGSNSRNTYPELERKPDYTDGDKTLRGRAESKSQPDDDRQPPIRYDPVKMEAYEFQKKLVPNNLPFLHRGLVRFSPIGQTRMAESYNTWRVLGWVDIRSADRDSDAILRQTYTVNMRHDPELGLWRQYGDIEFISCRELKREEYGREQRMEYGREVRIVNRKTGVCLWAPGANVRLVRGAIVVRIVRAGDYFKLWAGLGQYLALEDWAIKGQEVGPGGSPRILRLTPNEGDRSIFWKIEPLGNDSWSITNRETGKCVEAREPGARFPRQSEFRAGDAAQEWQFEPVSSDE